ncbi:LutC/YkgG family protein [Arcticibacter tournemirensis]
MSSREKILSSVKANQPSLKPLPSLDLPADDHLNLIENFTFIATNIGSRVMEVSGFDEIKEAIAKLFLPGRIVSSFTELADIAETQLTDPDPHSLANVNLAVLGAELGVSENGALWLSENNMMQRVLPFICQHLALVVNKKSIVANMHEAYRVLGNNNPGFGAFIAGPSKTADIEQSLVLGAHGPRSMTVFLI